MKARISRGSGFKGLLLYLLDEGPKATGKKRPELISTNLPGSDVKTFAAAFGAFKRLRPDIKRQVWHSSLRLPAGERLTSEKWAEVVAAYLQRMGFDDAAPHVVVRHNDVPDGDHVHIILSRVNSRSEVWLGQHEVRRAIAATQQLEREFSLTLTPGLGDVDAEAKAARPPRKADPQAIVNVNRSKGHRRVDTAEVARLLLDCAARSGDLPSFTAAAHLAGFTVKPNRSETTGRVSGLSVIPPGRKKFLKLGDATNKTLTWPKLLKIFEQNEQAAEVARLAARVVVDAADRRAAERVAARLFRDGNQTTVDPLQSTPKALLPADATKEAQSMARQHVDPNDQLGFLAEPPPRPAGRIDDAALVAQPDTGKREARERIDRERATAQSQIEDELQSATKAQLKRLRVALTNELHADDDEAIEQMLNRLLRLAVRVLTLGQVVLPHSEVERRVLAARHTIQLVDAEVRRRADVEARAASVPEKPRSQPEPATLRIVRGHDARQHQQPPAIAQRDRDEIARQQDAQRERNRK